MSAPFVIPARVVQAVLSLLLPLMLPLAGNDEAAAQDLAWSMLGDYHAMTAEELRLAAQVIAFSLQALQAAADAADPDLAPAQRSRYRGDAVRLRRAESLAQRRLLHR